MTDEQFRLFESRMMSGGLPSSRDGVVIERELAFAAMIALRVYRQRERLAARQSQPETEER